MAETLLIDKKLSKQEQYEQLLPQIKALLTGETDWVANLANAVAALRESFGFFWIGFYRIIDEELVLGPFQGPIACTRIRKGKGVCGMAWQENKTYLVENVDEFAGHIACSSLSKSEIVVPIQKNGVVWGVLDIDSDKLADFDEIDQKYLEQLVNSIVEPII